MLLKIDQIITVLDLLTTNQITTVLQTIPMLRRMLKVLLLILRNQINSRNLTIKTKVLEIMKVAIMLVVAYHQVLHHNLNWKLFITKKAPLAPFLLFFYFTFHLLFFFIHFVRNYFKLFWC